MNATTTNLSSNLRLPPKNLKPSRLTIWNITKTGLYQSCIHFGMESFQQQVPGGVSQRLPVYRAGQVQTYAVPLDEQVPPFRQGWLAQTPANIGRKTYRYGTAYVYVKTNTFSRLEDDVCISVTYGGTKSRRGVTIQYSYCHSNSISWWLDIFAMACAVYNLFFR